MLADGTVAMSVEGKEPGRVRLRVVQRGTIRSRQGINLPGVKLSVPAISEHDHRARDLGGAGGRRFRRPELRALAGRSAQLKDIVRSSGSTARVVAKIEKREALERLDEIVAAADAVMVARGDLGVEIDVAQMPIEQKRIIARVPRFQRPVIIATQMLDSMHDSPRPTRAEATDVANAILDGADACMLSGETAVGKYPARGGRDDEPHRAGDGIELAGPAAASRRTAMPTELHGITRAVVRAAGQMAYDLDAKLVFVASHSGRTALALSQQRSFVPTVGVSSSEATLRQMCLYWGVTPLRGAPATRHAGAHQARRRMGLPRRATPRKATAS